MITIINKNNKSIKEIIQKAKNNRAQITVFAAWASLTAFFLTTLIIASHHLASAIGPIALTAVTTEARDKTTETDKIEDVAKNTEESSFDETRDRRCRFRDRYKDGRRRPRIWERVLGDETSQPSESQKPKTAAGKPSNENIKTHKQDKAKAHVCTVDEIRKTSSSKTYLTHLTADTQKKDNSSTAETDLSKARTKPYNWYCKNNDKHARPELPAEFRFISEYDGYWLDKENCGKVIYLTFDAGYENGNIKKILDILKSKEVHSAFFVLDNLIRRNTDLVLRMANEGHLVCNHTSHHKDMTKLTESEFTSELLSLENTARDVAGIKLSKFYRPPCGTISERDLALAKKHGYKTIMWSYAYADWDNDLQPVPSKALERLQNHTHEGMILLLHPTSSTNAEILGDFIDRMKADGWRFETLTKLWSS